MRIARPMGTNICEVGPRSRGLPTTADAQNRNAKTTACIYDISYGIYVLNRVQTVKIETMQTDVNK